MSTMISPGPWEFVPVSEIRPGDNDLGGIRDADGNFVCYFGDDTMYYPSAGYPPNEADARLIVSAPKLLAALRVFVNLDETFVSTSIKALSEMAEADVESAPLVRAVIAAREAIAESTGQTP